MRILLVDDHTLVRAGIRALVEAVDGVRIVGEASNGREGVALCKQHLPDLVIMDISMKEMNGIEATEAVLASCPRTRVLILSMHTEEEFVRRAMRAGASGYIVKDSLPLELHLAIEAVCSDQIYISPRISRHLVSALGGRANSPLDALTLRQREVLQMIAEGKSTKEIAAALGLSTKTIETHRAAIMSRLGIRDIAGLVKYAARNHLVTLDDEHG